MGSRRVGHDWGHGAHRVWNVEADNPTLLGCNKNRPAALCSMLRLQFKVTANSTERNLQKKRTVLGKGHIKKRIIFLPGGKTASISHVNCLQLFKGFSCDSDS